VTRIVWWQRLGTRLAFGLGALALVAFGLIGASALRAQRRHLEGAVVRLAAVLSESIRESTHDLMLLDQRQEAYRTMGAIGRGAGIERIRIFSKTGAITFSTEAAEIGSVVDKRAESCFACHAEGRPLERPPLPSRSRVYVSKGHRVLAMVTPIYNAPSCSSGSCHAHPVGQRVLGVVDVGISLAEVDDELAALQNATFLAIGLGVLGVALGAGLFARRAVLGPLRALRDGTERVAEGDLAHRLDAGRGDELGQLAASFNHMTAALQAARTEIDGLLAGLERKVEQRTAALQEAQAQLVQAAKMASLGRMSASIAHEINNPLAGILTFSRLLVRELSEGPELPEREQAIKNLRLIEREAQRCTGIVRNLLDFARQRPLELKDVPLATVAGEALSLVAHALSLKQIAVEQRLDPGPTAKADFGQIRQAVVNVVLNACDAMDAGGRLAVSCAPAAEPGFVEIRVDDSGHGISPENLAHIFDPFFTTKKMGTGLGLSVVYGIVERHGGRLDVQSEVGRGTSVRLLLPAAGGSDA